MDGWVSGWVGEFDLCYGRGALKSHPTTGVQQKVLRISRAPKMRR